MEGNIYPITTPTGRVVLPPSSRSWVYSKERFLEFVADNRIWFGPDGNNVPATKKFLTEVKDGIVAMTFWPYQEVGHNQDAKVRKAIKDIGGTMPEDLPVADSIKKLERKEKKLKQLKGNNEKKKEK